MRGPNNDTVPTRVPLQLREALAPYTAGATGSVRQTAGG
jgi:enediyne biosynthesis thioesterase